MFNTHAGGSSSTTASTKSHIHIIDASTMDLAPIQEISLLLARNRPSLLGRINVFMAFSPGTGLTTPKFSLCSIWHPQAHIGRRSVSYPSWSFLQHARVAHNPAANLDVLHRNNLLLNKSPETRSPRIQILPLGPPYTAATTTQLRSTATYDSFPQHTTVAIPHGTSRPHIPI